MAKRKKTYYPGKILFNFLSRTHCPGLAAVEAGLKVEQRLADGIRERDARRVHKRDCPHAPALTKSAVSCAPKRRNHSTEVVTMSMRAT